MNSKGILIAFEGVDGGGKSTQVKLLAAALADLGESVVHSKEPTDGIYGRKLRESSTTGRYSLLEELQLFIDDRKEHIETLIAPSLRQGKIVILDRYFYSTIAYQGARGGDYHEIEKSMAEFAPLPDMTFLVDADPVMTRRRISVGRNETPNEFEGEDNLEACREIFNELCSRRGEMYRVDGQQTIELVHARVLDLVRQHRLLHHACREGSECTLAFCSHRHGSCRWVSLKITAASPK